MASKRGGSWHSHAARQNTDGRNGPGKLKGSADGGVSQAHQGNRLQMASPGGPCPVPLDPLLIIPHAPRCAPFPSGVDNKMNTHLKTVKMTVRGKDAVTLDSLRYEHCLGTWRPKELACNAGGLASVGPSSLVPLWCVVRVWHGRGAAGDCGGLVPGLACEATPSGTTSYPIASRWTRSLWTIPPRPRPRRRPVSLACLHLGATAAGAPGKRYSSNNRWWTL
jgi:hypothetical protein